MVVKLKIKPAKREFRALIAKLGSPIFGIFNDHKGNDHLIPGEYAGMSGHTPPRIKMRAEGGKMTNWLPENVYRRGVR